MVAAVGISCFMHKGGGGRRLDFDPVVHATQRFNL